MRNGPGANDKRTDTSAGRTSAGDADAGRLSADGDDADRGLSRDPTGPLRRLDGEAGLRQLFDAIPIPRETIKKKFPEWVSFERLCLELCHHGELYHLGDSGTGERRMPLVALSFGSRDPAAPTLVLTGGVHGLERIGAQVVLAFLTSLSELLLWDQLIKEALKKVRIVFFPLVNPIGILERTRHNPNGVDLMRNAPLDAKENPTFFVGGQRYSPRLPWYRGTNGLEPESVALMQLLEAQAFGSSRIVAVDFHSGFGTTDRIWFPFAGSLKPFPHLAEMQAWKEAFERTHPHHFYQIEPQAKNYTTHGDLWDYAYEEYYRKHTSGDVFLPLALEMGSWMWVKKNPLQLFSALGPFNPMKPHRLKRILRRHNSLFDFLIRSMVSVDAWVPTRADLREKHRTRAMATWYPGDDGSSGGKAPSNG